MRLILFVFAALIATQAARADNALVPVYQKLCDGGDASYCQALGNIYNEGRDGAPVDKAKAVALFVKACNGGANIACRYAADIYAKGEGVAKDGAKAATLYKRGCDLRDKDSCTKLAGTPAPTGAPAATAQPQTAGDLPKDPKAVLALAESGNAAAQNRIGFWHQSGRQAGFAKDEAKAIAWYTKAANQNYAAGMYNLCKVYDKRLGITNGLYTPKGALITPLPPLTGASADIAAAVSWCKKANETDGSAYDELGALYARGWPGAAPNYAEAYRLLSGGTTVLTDKDLKEAVGRKLTPPQRQAIDEKNKTCWGDPKCDLGLRKPGQTTATSSADAASIALAAKDSETYSATAPSRKACDGGDARGCLAVGEAFRDGQPPDYELALANLKKACNFKSAKGCYDTAWLYHNGQGTPKDLSKAAQLFESGCSGGIGASCAQAGMLYVDGQGVHADSAKALALFAQGCAAGDGFGCRDEGNMYYKPIGIAKDLTKAAAAYKQGCDLGDPNSCFVFGVQVAYGDGVRADKAAAAKLYKKACDLKYGKGCLFLGIALGSGDGIPQDGRAAWSYLNEACKMGEDDACKRLAGH